jgi:hypothetical protein
MSAADAGALWRAAREHASETNTGSQWCIGGGLQPRVCQPAGVGCSTRHGLKMLNLGWAVDNGNGRHKAPTDVFVFFKGL